jgi:sporulation protein YunB
MILFRRRGWRSRGTKKGSWKKLFFFSLVIFTFLSLQGFIFIEKNLRAPLMNIATLRIKQMAHEAINKAITENISNSPTVDKLIDWKMDKNDKITGVMFNYAEHMRITSDTVTIVQDTLKELQQVPDYIPVGQAFNSAILASYGPDVKVRFVPQGTVKIDLHTRQKDAGINMVLFEVYMRVITEVAIIIPFDTGYEVVETEIPISYVVLVGDVPMYYFDNKGQQINSSGGAGAIPPTISLPSLMDKDVGVPSRGLE